MAGKKNSGGDCFEEARRKYDGKKFGVNSGPVPLQEFRYTQKRGGDQPNLDLHPERIRRSGR